ncbi:MAG: hypothetical protein ACHQU1_02585 [Gemmatimonadales bacterium]
MRRSIIATALVVAAVGCNQQPQQQAAQAAAPARGSREWLVQSALAAAPAAVTEHAAIVDINAKVDSLKQLRAGTNGWTCVADDTTAHHMGAICADAEWMKWFAAWQGHKPFTVTSVGTAYMLAGSNDASNTDPFAMAPAAGKDWVVTGPHLMIIAPGAHPYAGLPTEPTTTGPYVMFPNTPYAHLMVPAQAPHAM